MLNGLVDCINWEVSQCVQCSSTSRADLQNGDGNEVSDDGETTHAGAILSVTNNSQ